MIRQVWYAARTLVPGSEGAREAGCRCPVQPMGEAWSRSSARNKVSAMILVAVSDQCPVHRETPEWPAAAAS